MPFSVHALNLPLHLALLSPPSLLHLPTLTTTPVRRPNMPTKITPHSKSLATTRHLTHKRPFARMSSYVDFPRGLAIEDFGAEVAWPVSSSAGAEGSWR